MVSRSACALASTEGRHACALGMMFVSPTPLVHGSTRLQARAVIPTKSEHKRPSCIEHGGCATTHGEWCA
eukprot:9887925-Lingulodinium_polyedra.AAC.1